MNRLGDLGVTVNIEPEEDEDDSVLSSIIQEYVPIKNGIKKIRQNVAELKKIIASDKKNAIPEKAKENSAAMNRLMADTGKVSTQVKREIADRKESDESFAQSAGPNERTQVEMRANLYNSSTREFYDAMNEYSNCCKTAQSNMKDQLARRLQIVSEGEISNEKMEELMEDPQRAQEVIRGAIQGDSVKSLVNEVNQRHDQMRNLERQVKVVYELFRDLDVLVDVQGERLEMISNHVSSAHNHVKTGTRHLEDAIVHKKKANAFKCYLIIALAVVLVFLVLYFTLLS